MKKGLCGRMNKIGNYSKGYRRISQKKGCVLATGESKLSKEVYYVDTMEIPDMEAWMKPNVLYITTGYAYSGTKEKILSLIKSLHDVNAAAIAIKSRFIGAYME